MKIEINDKRQQKDFKKITFSTYKKGDAKKELIKCIYNGKIENACYWSAEFICAGHFLELWEIIFECMAKLIYITNPKLPIYIWMRFEIFKNILSKGYLGYEIRMRNNEKVRKLFAEIITILCLSRKYHSLNIIKVTKEEFNMVNLTNNLKAKNILYGKMVFRDEDPNELFIAINELSYHLSKDSKNCQKACYWVEWIIQFSSMCKCKGARRSYIEVEAKMQMDIIWIVWELIQRYSKNNLMREKIVNHLLKLFCVHYSPVTKKKRRFIIYFAIMLITEPIDYTVNIFENEEIINNVKNKINIVYKQIKKNEVAPKTDYLFNNSFTGGKNVENTIKKLEKMDTLLNIYHRT